MSMIIAIRVSPLGWVIFVLRFASFDYTIGAFGGFLTIRPDSGARPGVAAAPNRSPSAAASGPAIPPAATRASVRHTRLHPRQRWLRAAPTVEGHRRIPG